MITSGTVTIPPQSILLDETGSVEIGDGATWINSGTVVDAGEIQAISLPQIYDKVSIIKTAGAVFNLTSSSEIGDPKLEPEKTDSLAFTNAGQLNISGGYVPETIVAIDNTGTIEVTAGVLEVTGENVSGIAGATSSSPLTTSSSPKTSPSKATSTPATAACSPMPRSSTCTRPSSRTAPATPPIR